MRIIKILHKTSVKKSALSMTATLESKKLLSKDSKHPLEKIMAAKEVEITIDICKLYHISNLVDRPLDVK